MKNMGTAVLASGRTYSFPRKDKCAQITRKAQTNLNRSMPGLLLAEILLRSYHSLRKNERNFSCILKNIHGIFFTAPF